MINKNSCRSYASQQPAIGQLWKILRKEKYLKKTERLMLHKQIHLLSLLMRLVYRYA